MKSSLCLVACLGGLLILSRQWSFAQSGPVAIPHFLLMGDSTGLFLGYPVTDVFRYVVLADPQDSDEGLFTGACVRNFVLHTPDSVKLYDLPAAGRALPSVIAYVENFGMYDLAPLVAEKAIEFSKLPLSQSRY